MNENMKILINVIHCHNEKLRNSLQKFNALQNISIKKG